MMLKIEGLTKRFGKLTAIDNLNLNIPEGLKFGLLGPNGSGKTTLLRMITGLIEPTHGKITLFGKWTPTSRMIRRRVGYMPQQTAVYPGLTVSENIRFFGRIYGLSGRPLEDRLNDILELVELGDKKKEVLSNLSGGMVRRVLLATALIHNPPLLILDEPTAGVDPVLRLKFWDWVDLLVKQGVSIIITTHHISEAERSDQVVFLREGKIIQQGKPFDIMKRFQANNLEAAFVRSTNLK
ncbi:MAG: ABC transporter ATP-binding protein [Deltaproteobacteria bacterium]|nr:ABC transporter ATP-binding protein [Deltaproteobacteria bacterium]